MFPCYYTGTWRLYTHSHLLLLLSATRNHRVWRLCTHNYNYLVPFLSPFNKQMKEFHTNYRPALFLNASKNPEKELNAHCYPAFFLATSRSQKSRLRPFCQTWHFDPQHYQGPTLSHNQYTLWDDLPAFPMTVVDLFQPKKSTKKSPTAVAEQPVNQIRPSQPIVPSPHVQPQYVETPIDGIFLML